MKTIARMFAGLLIVLLLLVGILLGANWILGMNLSLIQLLSLAFGVHFFASLSMLMVLGLLVAVVASYFIKDSRKSKQHSNWLEELNEKEKIRLEKELRE